jgi:hypothetical protein
LVGNSHLRGYAAGMKVFLNDQFEVFGYVKPGASSKVVLESAKSDIESLTMDDFLILCCGSNDVNNNDLRKAFHSVTSFVKNANQTNVILLCIPCRYDLMNSHINSEIRAFNRKLCKLAKIFSHVSVIELDNNRQLFTAHGLHLNSLGKEVLYSYLLHIYSALKEVMGSVITLAWLDSNFQDSSSLVASNSTLPAISDNQNTTNEIIVDTSASTPCLDRESLTSCTVNGNINVGNPSILMTRTSSRIKKAPVTKTKNLW